MAKKIMEIITKGRGAGYCEVNGKSLEINVFTLFNDNGHCNVKGVYSLNSIKDYWTDFNHDYYDNGEGGNSDSLVRNLKLLIL